MSLHFEWKTLYESIEKCGCCELAKQRGKVVIGEGNPGADVLLVGEGPGRDEDLTGRPFVGAAGQLLDKMLCAVDARCPA